ncbi:MAG: hypothetical protein Q8O90_13010 [Elusimicrobiota bacterium]|nr:hypothetical protein [Elusimicrobiota bacterium]
MREKYLWLAISVLTVLTLGQACYIYEDRAVAKEFMDEQPPGQPDIHLQGHAEKAFDAQQEEFEKWRGKVREQINQGFPLSDRDFDIFFGDRFFTGRASPFTEMERLRRQLSGEFRDSDKTLFDGYWDKWFEQRMRLGRFKTEIGRTDKEVTLTISLPVLAGGTADVNIKEGRIKLSFLAKSASEHKSAGSLIKKVASESHVKIIPVPNDAVPGTGKVQIDGELVRIKFERRTD